MTVVTPLPSAPESELDRNIILKIFSSIGRCRFIDEKQFDACTALSGSGPAFACIFLEAMADGGVMMGLPRAEALELAAQSELACCDVNRYDAYFVTQPYKALLG
jgi:pyrroline-5-carboxylate reductase